MTLASLISKLEPVERLFLFVLTLAGITSVAITVLSWAGVGPIPTPAAVLRQVTELKAQVADNQRRLEPVLIDLCLRLTPEERAVRRLECRRLLEPQ